MPRAHRGLAVAVLLVASAVAIAEETADVVILSSYRSRLGANARPRLLPQAGVDFAAPVGTPVLAAADGARGHRRAFQRPPTLKRKWQISPSFTS